MPDFEPVKVNERLLVIDDDPMIRKMLSDVLTAHGYVVDSVPGSSEAMESLAGHSYHLLLLDVKIPGMSGFEFLRYCKRNHPDMEIIIITGKPDLEDAVSSVKDGAFDYLAKPFSNEKLLSQIQSALAARNRKMAELAGSFLSESGAHFQTEACPLPDCRVIRQLGAGAMSTVFLVEREEHLYALKILRRNMFSGSHAEESRLARFIREADILSKVNHPNVVRIYHAGFSHDGKIPYILLEYVEGRPLTELIEQNVLTLEEKLHILRQIAQALDAVHEQQVLHRDVKPGNIILMAENKVKLTDFGIAKLAGSSLTLPHEMLGSPAYMPPEAFEHDVRLTPASDIFSLGILAYELITGVKPFHGDTVPAMIKAIREHRPAKPEKYVPGLPQSVEDFLAKLLKKNPEERYQNMKQVVHGLNVIQGNGQIDSLVSTTLKQIFNIQKDWE